MILFIPSLRGNSRISLSNQKQLLLNVDGGNSTLAVPINFQLTPILRYKHTAHNTSIYESMNFMFVIKNGLKEVLIFY